MTTRNRRLRPHALLVSLGLLLALGTPRLAGATTKPANVPNTMYDKAATSAARDVIVRVDEALNAITYTYYSSRNVWDAWKGVYKVVCVWYVNHVLDDAFPAGYDAVRTWVGKSYPSVWDYFAFFRSIPTGSTYKHWKRMKRLQDLRPGDLITYRWDSDNNTGTWGHIMFVVSVPVRDTRWSNVWKVRVSDSSSDPHGNDNRCSSCTGVGAGEALFKVDSEGRVTSMGWTTYGTFKAGRTWVLTRPAY